MQFARWGGGCDHSGECSFVQVCFCGGGWGRTRRGERVRKSFTKEGTLKLGINRYRASTL